MLKIFFLLNFEKVVEVIYYTTSKFNPRKVIMHGLYPLHDQVNNIDMTSLKQHTGISFNTCQIIKLCHIHFGRPQGGKLKRLGCTFVLFASSIGWQKWSKISLLLAVGAGTTSESCARMSTYLGGRNLSQTESKLEAARKERHTHASLATSRGDKLERITAMQTSGKSARTPSSHCSMLLSNSSSCSSLFWGWLLSVSSLFFSMAVNIPSITMSQNCKENKSEI